MILATLVTSVMVILFHHHTPASPAIFTRKEGVKHSCGPNWDNLQKSVNKNLPSPGAEPLRNAIQAAILN